MNERLRKLRKTLDLTQKEFGNRIGVKGNTIAQYEIGRNKPIDAVLSLICREFSVNEQWLRTGLGEMFLPVEHHSTAEFTHQFLNDDSDSFKNRFISMLANLSTDEWALIEKNLKNWLV